jgi:hypothetical protein
MPLPGALWMSRNSAILVLTLAAGCASEPPAEALPAQVARLSPGMSLVDVRQCCGDAGELLFRSGFEGRTIELRELPVRHTFRSMYLFFRSGRLVAIHPSNDDSQVDIWGAWREKRERFRSVGHAEADADHVFGSGGLPFHGDFATVDEKARKTFQDGEAETAGMVIALSWWNPLAWVVLPGFMIWWDVARGQLVRFLEQVDGIQIGDGIPQVVQRLGRPVAKISRPGGIAYFVFERMVYPVTIGFRDGVVRGVYPSQDAREGHPSGHNFLFESPPASRRIESHGSRPPLE